MILTNHNDLSVPDDDDFFSDIPTTVPLPYPTFTLYLPLSTFLLTVPYILLVDLFSLQLIIIVPLFTYCNYF